MIRSFGQPGRYRGETSKKKLEPVSRKNPGLGRNFLFAPFGPILSMFESVLKEQKIIVSI